MNKMLCAKCGKNPAVVFISKIQGDDTTQEGLCLKCAMDMNIGPIKQMMENMKKNQFGFDDYLESMNQMKKMGGLSSILGMMPGMGGAQLKQIEDAMDEKKMARIEAIILSMTPKERRNPDIINPSRKRRIAKGAGVDISEVNRLVKQFEQSQKMMKQMSGMMGKKGRRMRFPF